MLWGHCHHRATGGVETEQQVLEKMGVATDSVVGGCCGLAGSWGFENGKWRDLDRLRRASIPAGRTRRRRDAVVVANGFSCQTQLEQAPDTNRRRCISGR